MSFFVYSLMVIFINISPSLSFYHTIFNNTKLLGKIFEKILAIFKLIVYNTLQLNTTLSRATEGTGPVKSGNLHCKVLNPAVITER